ncbi:MAG: hypothetical protein AMXMBFR59_16690 [Rhodanobacteraceae bacterium]
MSKSKVPKPKRFGLLSESQVQEIRDQLAPVEAIKAARARSAAEGKATLYSSAAAIPMTRLERLAAERERVNRLGAAELVRRIDERKGIGAKAGARRAVAEAEKTKWLAMALELRAKNRSRSMTDISEAVGKKFKRSGRAVREHLKNFWERS